MRQKKQGARYVKAGQKSPPTVAVNASPQRKSRNLQKAYATEGAIHGGNSISSKGVTNGSGTNMRQNISFESRSGNKGANQSGKKAVGNSNQQYFN